MLQILCAFCIETVAIYEKELAPHMRLWCDKVVTSNFVQTVENLFKANLFDDAMMKKIHWLNSMHRWSENITKNRFQNHLITILLLDVNSSNVNSSNFMNNSTHDGKFSKNQKKKKKRVAIVLIAVRSLFCFFHKNIVKSESNMKTQLLQWNWNWKEIGIVIDCHDDKIKINKFKPIIFL